MSNVPLPCPFCGGAPNQQTDRVYWPKFRVFCDHGAEHAVFIGGDTQEAAIAAWNRRAHAAKDDEIERLRARVRVLEDALRGLMVGCKYCNIQGQWHWHEKAIASNEALDAARTALEKP